MIEKPTKQSTTNDNNDNQWSSKLTGYMMIIGSIGLFGLLAWKFFEEKAPASPFTLESGFELYAYLIQYFGDDALILIAAVFLTIIGTRLIGKSSKGMPTIIPEKDRQLLEPLIKEGKKEAIDQYVRLSSLSGFTGTFQKIGFTGLPLATAILTLIFSALSFQQAQFLELAKLTLGAFIGSFVQKGTDIITMQHEDREDTNKKESRSNRKAKPSNSNESAITEPGEKP